MRSFTTLLMLLVAFCALGYPAAAADEIYLELMASRVSIINGEFTGHAFMCIELLLNNGVKEECYGFYPKADNIKGYIGGPGVIQSEFQKKPDRFSRVDQSVKAKITIEQRSKILGIVNNWDKADYSLTKQQCVDFINSVAIAAGLKTPPRNTTDFPLDYLIKLKSMNP
jgi:hypothetical protein